MAAQVYLAARGKPAQPVPAVFGDTEGGLGEIVFTGDVHHRFLIEPLVHNAHCRRIAAEHTVGKSVNNILLHAYHSLIFKLTGAEPLSVLTDSFPSVLRQTLSPYIEIYAPIVAKIIT